MYSHEAHPRDAGFEVDHVAERNATNFKPFLQSLSNLGMLVLRSTHVNLYVKEILLSTRNDSENPEADAELVLSCLPTVSIASLSPAHQEGTVEFSNLLDTLESRHKMGKPITQLHIDHPITNAYAQELRRFVSVVKYRSEDGKGEL